jgi:hypothetical protein
MYIILGYGVLAGLNICLDEMYLQTLSLIDLFVEPGLPWDDDSCSYLAIPSGTENCLFEWFN